MSPTEKAIANSPRNETQWQREVDRCRAEIAAIEEMLRAGHPSIEGLCLALSDWSAELRILEGTAAQARTAAGS